MHEPNCPRTCRLDRGSIVQIDSIVTVAGIAAFASQINVAAGCLYQRGSRQRDTGEVAGRGDGLLIGEQRQITTDRLHGRGHENRPSRSDIDFICPNGRQPARRRHVDVPIGRQNQVASRGIHNSVHGHITGGAGC